MNKIKVDTKSILLTATGACLEWYEFSIFMYVTPMISKAFFPKQNPLIALLASFGLLAAGYLMRPVGGMIFGNLGDKWGRKKILIITTGLMMIPMLGTAILPTYHQWGTTAVILLLLLRMFQGLSVGGEYTSVLTMLLEQAPKNHRALTTSLASIVSGLGVVLSALVVTILTYYLGEQRMYAWGWRIPFALGFLLSVCAYFSQLKLHESPYFKKAIEQKKITKTPIIHALKEHPRDIFYVFVMAGFLGIPCYLGLAFFPNYLITVFHMNKESVMQITTLCDLIYLPFIPIAAFVSDKIGRKPILILTTILFIVTAYPAFILINSHSLTQALWGNSIILILYGCEVAIFVTMINELFPTEQRLSGVSTGYNVGNAIFGGTTPLVVTYFISHSGNHFAPAWYLAISAIITLLFIFTMPETYSKKL